MTQLAQKAVTPAGTEPVGVVSMLLGKLDSDSDSDSDGPNAPSSYKPRRLSLSDSDVHYEKHAPEPANGSQLEAFSSACSLLSDYQSNAIQFFWKLWCRREGGVLVSCIVRNFLNKDGSVHSVLSREVEVLS
jgi:hypothetical protein